ncbi:hypothetical protein D1007_18356 [Hordeum vulgare]|nr:hypothetical protein D1007_18356 [Hordeum vulgare]
MDDDLDAATGLASLASSGIMIAPSLKGKPRTPRKTATAPKKNKELTPKDKAREYAKIKGHRHAAGVRDKAAVVVAIAAVVKRKHTAAHVTTATREALL